MAASSSWSVGGSDQAEAQLPPELVATQQAATQQATEELELQFDG